MINLFYGFDPRQEAGSHVFCSSVINRSTSPVSLIPLHLKFYESFYKPGLRDGVTTFTYSKFLIPFLQDFKGWAIFCDGADMLCRADISELWALRDHYKAVQVVKHDYKTKHPRKYVGTKMEAENRDYPRKNWSSVMLINCGHFDWRQLKPETVEKMSGEELHSFSWLRDPDLLGELPKEWNWLCQEHGYNKEAKIVHFSAGSPGFLHYAMAPHAEEWRTQRRFVDYLTD
jgi:hypothetical protein